MSWSKGEIDAGRARCVHLLQTLDMVAVPAEPVRDGECGAAAPVDLVSVGKSPQVVFNPPVTVTCDMAAALHAWVTKDLQALSRKHLGAPLVRVDTMSSYSCRTAYGRARNRLSEHGRANAIDIRGFVTARGESTDVLADWGPTARDIRAQVAAAQAAAQKAEAERATAAAKLRNEAIKAAKVQPPVQPGQPGQQGEGVTTATIPQRQPMAAAAPGAETGEAAPQVTPPTISVGAPGIAIQFPGAGGSIGLSNIFGSPSRLGGPKPRDGAAPVIRGSDVSEGRMQFLRGAHAAACRIFGTVLGPESNNAHRNHFHVDLAERSSAAFCE